MASAQRSTDTHLAGEAEISAFHEGDDFFDIVRCIERRALAACDDATRPLIGQDGPPANEAVRFRGAHDLAFPSRAVERVTRNIDNNRYDLIVTFMGLTGPTGVMPSHYGNLIQSRMRQRDYALADFFDLFNHRLLSLYYRAWSKYRIAEQSEIHAAAPAANPFAQALKAFAGQHSFSEFDPRLYYAGHFSRFTRSASNLESLLGDFLQIPVRIEPFIGQWLPIQEKDRVRIGHGANGRNNKLGEGIMTGRRAWDTQSKFRIEIGPTDDVCFEQLMPGREHHQQLCRLINEYIPAHLDVELMFLVRGHTRKALGRKLQLGLNCWIYRQTEPTRIARIQLRRYQMTAPRAASPSVEYRG